MSSFHVHKLDECNPELVRKLKTWCYELNGCCFTVHNELGPFLNEYIYQDALEIVMKERGVEYAREYYFSIDFHGQRIQHKHYVDFMVRNKAILECKAVAQIVPDHRQQLWNYMRLTKTHIGVLWNFAPVKDQSEHYYLDTETDVMYIF